ncbi:DUF2478 domain-containing protein [Vannielia sp. SX4]|uniref:DUF2478 domain-containing protein n=1 Tax=Vannielia sp. SX4 TaxID=3463852 RepID=UPI0040594A12
MRLGYILSETRGEADGLLADLAARLRAEGRVVAGVVQTRAPSLEAHPCDMELSVLPDGPGIEISQRLGAARADAGWTRPRWSRPPQRWRPGWVQGPT